ncbi:MAG TPA: acetyl-CoA carboxylase biotin carboxyl carrier protein subunit [Clostridia bacterium]|nr:acetyl-CoA carboxylase biotin carboxyl carrier protein subunit [Clostridia bacterium]
MTKGGDGLSGEDRQVHDRAVRVGAPLADQALGLRPIVVEPGPHPGMVIVDGTPANAGYERLDERHGRLTEMTPVGPVHTRIEILPAAGDRQADGIDRHELLVDGWRIEIEREPERRAALRALARRGGAALADHGPTEVRAIIPGRVLAVSVAAGDSVVTGQQLLVVEAMKMQNELRAPRDGTVERIAVEPGRTVELGDVLLVLA